MQSMTQLSLLFYNRIESAYFMGVFAESVYLPALADLGLVFPLCRFTDLTTSLLKHTKTLKTCRIICPVGLDLVEDDAYSKLLEQLHHRFELSGLELSTLMDRNHKTFRFPPIDTTITNEELDKEGYVEVMSYEPTHLRFKGRHQVREGLSRVCASLG